MAITHAAVKASGERGYASEWNADHVVTEEDLPLRSVTLIVAASDSLDKTRADYVCDGTADQAEINTAITDLPATGGKIQLLEGTYTLSNTITILKNNVMLSGCGWGTVLYLVAGANTCLITVGDYSVTCSGVEIRDMEIDGNNANQTSWDRGVFFYRNVTKSRIHNLHIKNCRDGIYFYVDCTYNEISDCVLEQTGAFACTYGIGFYSGCDNNIICRNKILGHLLGIGIYLSDCNVLSGNICNNNKFIGIRMLNSERSLLVGNICNNNNTSLSGGAGISITVLGAENCRYNTVSGNVCCDDAATQDYGISETVAGANYNIILGNCCVGNIVANISTVGANTIKEHNQE